MRAKFKVLFLTLAFICKLSEGVLVPIVINTWAFSNATTEAWRVLQETDSPLEALVAGCGRCEIDQCDGTVGYGGSPDENGETTLDAMIMDGSTMKIGAVAALREVKSAIAVAKHVLLYTRHSLLVGDQATEFAENFGFKRERLTTSHSKNIWMEWRNNNCQPNFWANVNPKPEESCGPYKVAKNQADSIDMDTKKFNFGLENHDTIGMIVIDKTHQIFAGTSTNGANHKIAGRVGDSPIPGAGAYCDNEYGAATATGDGDVMMRFLPSYQAVENLRNGQTPQEAARNSLTRILKYYPDFMGGLIVVNTFGKYSAACAGIDRFPFSVITGLDDSVRVEYAKCN